jgi:hypothetical protein
MRKEQQISSSGYFVEDHARLFECEIFGLVLELMILVRVPSCQSSEIQE